MSVRLRILLGYGYLVALLLLATGSAIVGFFHLSSGVEVVLEENLSSVRSAMDMIEALERQDSATLATLIDRTEAAPASDLDAHERAFLKALDAANANITEEGEREAVAEIRLSFAAYRQARDALIAERPERALAAYNQRVFSPFAEVKGDVLRLLALNQQAMAHTDRAMRELALRNGTWLGFLVVVALVSLVFLSRVMQQRVLRRLEDLESGIRAIAAGQQRRLPEEGRDELALIARRVNGLLDQYEQLERRSHGRVAQERRLVLGLLQTLGEGIALFGLSGELLAGAVADHALAARLADWIRGEGRERAESARPEPVTVSAGAAHAELELVLAPGSRPVAWLARLPPAA
ncbi:MAG TPA: HAMP domain-containing protein [Thermoanaerobaculia bacterium]|nr:HAMP domain-containing protein [Thermoanaerobaculia bacterium]